MATKIDEPVLEPSQRSAREPILSPDCGPADGTKSKNEKSKNGGVKASADQPKTPPPQRKLSKLAMLGRIFRPWKWRRKKKSEKIQKTAIDLERKISVRTSREELIKKGVIIEREEPIQHTPTLEKVDESQEQEVVKTPSNGAAAGEPVANSIAKDHNQDSDKQGTIPGQDGDTGQPPPVAMTTDDVENVNHDGDKVTGKDEPVTIVSPTQVKFQVESSATVVNNVITSSSIPIETTEEQSLQTQSAVRFQAPVKDISQEENGEVPPPLPSTSPPRENGDYDNLPGDYEIEEPPIRQLPPGYEEIPAKEPNLNLLPKKSALKGASGGGAVGGSMSRPLMKPVPKPRTVKLPERVVEMKENNTGDYDNLPGEESSSDDEEIKYRDDNEESWVAKVARNDSLARFLSNRPAKTELLEKNIIPSQTEEEKNISRKEIGSKLIRRLSLRPTLDELEQKNILHQQSLEQRRKEIEETRKKLVRKLSFRPTIEELKQRKIIQFSDYVEVTEAEEYDRKAEKPWTKLTPRDKALIRKELNEFKSAEMDVHDESRKFTRFHRP